MYKHIAFNHVSPSIIDTGLFCIY